MKATRYTNKNSYTVFLPTPRGGQVAFHQGQGTTDSWYSRFTGPRQLSVEQVEIDDKGKIKVLSAPTVVAKKKELEMPVAHTSPTHSPVFVDEETPEYRRVRGVLQCKLCDCYRTGSSIAMKEHIEGYHGHTPSAVAPQAPKQEEIVMTTKGAVTQPVVETAPAAPPAVTTVTSPMGDTLYACTHPGCDKKFVSEKGLNMHVRRAHPEK